MEILTAEWQKKIFEGKSTYVLHGLTLVTKIEEKEEEPDGSDEIPDAAKNGNAVFMLQPVSINGHVFRFMFDSGCETFVCRKAAVDLQVAKKHH